LERIGFHESGKEDFNWSEKGRAPFKVIKVDFGEKIKHLNSLFKFNFWVIHAKSKEFYIAYIEKIGVSFTHLNLFDKRFQ
jgi:hypothetical protein